MMKSTRGALDGILRKEDSAASTQSGTRGKVHDKGKVRFSSVLSAGPTGATTARNSFSYRSSTLCCVGRQIRGHRFFSTRSLLFLNMLGLFVPNALVLRKLFALHAQSLPSSINSISTSSSLLIAHALEGIYTVETSLLRHHSRDCESELRTSSCASSRHVTHGKVSQPVSWRFNQNHLEMEKYEPDYAGLSLGLKFNRLDGNGFGVRNTSWTTGRVIIPQDDRNYHRSRKEQLQALDDHTDWWDTQFVSWEERDYPLKHGPHCYPPKWTTVVHPSCSVFHENVLFERSARTHIFHTYDFQYLARGHFRLSFLFSDASPMHDDFVIKPIRLVESVDQPFDQYTFNTVGIEALAMERTTASDRTIDIYGHCGGSVILEPGSTVFHKLRPRKFFIDQDVLDRRHPYNAVAYNNLTSPEKLLISLAMAEGLAELHGDKDGALVNRDVQIEQFVVSRKSGKIKLVDFNNVVPLKWNIETQEYCPYKTTFKFIYRSPEELTRKPTDESSDVYALGQVMYTILTGMLPYYSSGSYAKALELNKKGETPYMDSRYRRGYIESRMMDIMERSWKKDRFERPSIFEVVDHLRETVRVYERKSNISMANMTFRELAERDY